MNSRKLHIGCGDDIKEGWINLDIVYLPGVDVVHNIENLPLPFEDNSFDEILCYDVLEHIEYIPVLKDILRILAPQGALHIHVPHYTTRDNFGDPTHVKRFCVSTFDFFARNTHIWKKRGYYFDFSFEKSIDVRIHFDKTGSRLFFYNRLVEYLVNKKPRYQELYEMTGFCYLFPAKSITLTLVK